MFDEAPPANTYSLTHYIHRFTWALLLFCSVGLLASSVYRAATFPFTHDESLSFAIFSWEPGVLTRLSSTRWNKMMALMAPATIAVAFGWHFYRSFNTHFVYAWQCDAHNYEILQIINQDREHNFGSRTVTLGNSWNMEPSLNFYRVTHNYTWLAPVTQKPISNRYNDYIMHF